MRRIAAMTVLGVVVSFQGAVGAAPDVDTGRAANAGPAAEAPGDRDAPTTAALPNCEEKPAQGNAPLKNAPLDKRKSRCVIKVDDHTVELGEFIAYASIADGRKRTTIVATESPIDQRPLLDRLKSTGSDKQWQSKSPFLKLELDDTGRPQDLSFHAQEFHGGGEGDQLEGEAIVEGGRARGTAKLKTQKLSDQTYSAEITFDVPVLTGDSTPPQRLAGAAVLADGGKLVFGTKTVSLKHVTAYENRRFELPRRFGALTGDQTVTTVLLTERPIDLAKLKASLADPKQSDSDFNVNQSHVKMVIDAREDVTLLSIRWEGRPGAYGQVAGIYKELKAPVIIEDGRVRGTAKMTLSQAAHGRQVELDASFDTTVMKLPTAK